MGTTDIWVLPLAEPEKEFPLIQTPFNEMSGQFSPDGRWVAYVSRATGRDEVYVTPFPEAGARWQVSGNGGRQPRWSHDGRSLYFDSTARELMVSTVDGRGARPVIADARPLFRLNMFIGPRVGTPGYDVAPDDKNFLVNSAGEAGDPRVELIVNWDAELPR
jgi:hypothetical protein